MSSELFIARKIHFSGGEKDSKQATPPVIRIAIGGIAIGLAVMILSVAVVIGFKNEVSNKVIGFGSHIQISSFDSNTSYETESIDASEALLSRLAENPEIERFQRFATKPAIIKTDSVVEGVVLKGVGAEYDFTFLKDHLMEGTLPSFDNQDKPSNEVLISKYTADRLEVKCGESFITYFLQGSIKARRFTIKGIYETGFSDYDKLFVMADLRHLQRLNEWDSTQVSGIEVVVKNFDKLEQVSDDLYFDLQELTDKEGGIQYYVRSIKEISPQIFSWLGLLDLNVWIILALMISVSGFTMISGLLIIILERANMIGVLKAMGASDWFMQKTFLYVATFLIGKGILWGNVVGISLVIVQALFHVVKLDATIYYVSYVPVEVNLLYLLLLNVGTLVLTLLMLLGPSMIISKINPVKAIRYE